jgi:hypothetical protein
MEFLTALALLPASLGLALVLQLGLLKLVLWVIHPNAGQR